VTWSDSSLSVCAVIPPPPESGALVFGNSLNRLAIFRLGQAGVREHAIMRRRVCGGGGQQAEERYRDFLARWGRVAGTELMPSLVVGDTECCCGKLKSGNRFLKPNFEPGPNWVDQVAI
jgi:hypothetical protein